MFKESGFSLLEALISLAILALIAGFSITSFANMLAKTEINSAINNFQAAFYLAQKESIRSKHQIAICPSEDGFSCIDKWAAGYEIDYSCGFILFDTYTNRVLRDFPPSNKNLKLILRKGRGAKLQFLNNGRMQSNMNGANLSAKYKNQIVTINIASTGRIRNASK